MKASHSLTIGQAASTSGIKLNIRFNE